MAVGADTGAGHREEEGVDRAAAAKDPEQLREGEDHLGSWEEARAGLAEIVADASTVHAPEVAPSSRTPRAARTAVEGEAVRVGGQCAH